MEFEITIVMNNDNFNKNNHNNIIELIEDSEYFYAPYCWNALHEPLDTTCFLLSY